MNRRSFLSGLIALPVAAQLGRVNRVYSFPTNIVIADNREIMEMWSTASGWKSHEDIIKPLLPRSVLRVCGPSYRAVLATALNGVLRGMEDGRRLTDG